MAGQSAEQAEIRAQFESDIDEAFQPGFNWSTVWAMLFIAIIMLPGAIYLGLVAGQSMGGAAEWVTIILFLEISRRSLTQLKRQEIIILYWTAAGLVTMGGKLGSGAILFGGPFGGLIWDQYLVQSPQADAIAQFMPSWFVPPRGSEALEMRSFLHIDWLIPIVVLIIHIVLHRINSTAMGYALFRVINDVERLPFPMAPVQAGGATALAETSQQHEGWRWRVFSIGSIVGLAWGSIYIVIPTLSETFLTQTVEVIPIPWIDFTVNLRSVLPASTLGLATDLGTLLAGFVLPFWIVVGTFISAMASNFIVNPLLYNYSGPEPGAGILHRWQPGMSLIPTQISNSLDLYLSVQIGMAVMVAFIGFWMVGKALLGGKRELEDSPQEHEKGCGPFEGRGDVKLWIAIAVWIGATTASIILVRVLIPDFQWWITALFGFVASPILSYITARMIGLAGTNQGLSFPYLAEGTFYLSGYEGAAIWFAPMPYFNNGGMAQTFRVLVLTRTKFSSYVYMTALSLVIMLVFSFIFWSLIWKLSPIPSNAYPYVQKMWPYHATMTSLWASSTLPGGESMMAGVIQLKYIVTGAVAGVLLYFPLTFLKAPTTLFYGLVTGLTTFPVHIIPMFAGAMLGKYYFQKRFGIEKWRQYAPIILAGYSCGMGLVSMTSIAVALIVKSISQVIF